MEDSRDTLIKLSNQQVRQIIERGYTFVDVGSHVVKATRDDLVFKKEEVETLFESLSEHLKKRN